MSDLDGPDKNNDRLLFGRRTSTLTSSAQDGIGDIQETLAGMNVDEDTLAAVRLVQEFGLSIIAQNSTAALSAASVSSAVSEWLQQLPQDERELVTRVYGSEAEVIRTAEQAVSQLREAESSHQRHFAVRDLSKK